MSAHTPGPWLIVQDDDFAGLSIRSGNERDASHISYLQICADINGLRKKSEKYADTEAQANARLIAAAPDMYAVLRELSECSQYWSEYDVPLGIHDRIAAALAKADSQ